LSERRTAALSCKAVVKPVIEFYLTE